MDHASEARLQNVVPLLAVKIRTMETMLADEGIEIMVTQGLRTIAEQDALYAQGRSVPGAKVTNCPGGHSYHNFGLAVDCCPSQFAPGKPFTPDWHPEHPSWKRMEAVGKSLGLDSGAYWRTFHDAPHFQLTGRFPEGAPNQELQELLHSGMQAVWDAVMQSYKGA
jgi:peptidoglycan L-alanyl-D-glutamate endopeptidase CwlK